jgi:multidrug/hemolysin transport system permease protein
MTLCRLVKRNILVYSRNRSTIFFSLLSTIIIIALMAMFLGQSNTDNVLYLLNQYGGVRDAAADRANAEQLVLLWTLAGIIVVNSVTITLTMVGFMVSDEEYNKLSSFYVSPVNRGVFVLGYILAAIVMGIVMCCLTLGIGELFVWYTGGELLNGTQLLRVLLFIVLNVFMSSSLMFFIINFVHSTSALSGLSTIIGTLVGFLAAIYLPMGALPAKVQTVVKSLPLLHGSALMREAFTEDILKTTYQNCPGELLEGFKDYMGITVRMGEHMMSSQIQVAFLLISGIILIIISAFIQRKRNTVIR